MIKMIGFSTLWEKHQGKTMDFRRIEPNTEGALVGGTCGTVQALSQWKLLLEIAR